MRFLIPAILFLVMSVSAPSYAELTKNEAVKKIEDHLNQISTMKADFTQISADGGVSNGQFFLARPGKLRWQYEPPVPLLIIADGKKMQYHDLELNTVSYVDIDSTLAGIMARPEINLTSKDIVVKSFDDSAGVIRVTLIKKDKVDDGSLTLVMNDNPMSLKKMEVIDSAKQKTTISFSSITFDLNLDNKLFVFDDTKEYPTNKN